VNGRATSGNTTPLDIRPFDPESFIRDEAAFLAIAADIPGEYWSRENFLRELPEKWNLSFAVFDAGRPVGYAILSRRTDELVHLHHFMIAPKHRGAGFGTRMITEIAARVAAAGAQRISLKTVSPPAQRFYRRNGFWRVGEDNGYVVMVRRLDRTPTAQPVIAIHQPNYLPWLGYFHKVARADVFVFLETVQFSKGSVTNRVRIRRGGEPVWLTQKVRQALGQPITTLSFVEADWPRRHLDALHGAYRDAPKFRAVFPVLESLMLGAPTDTLSAANRHLIEGLAHLLGLKTIFVQDSALGVDPSPADDRLVTLVDVVAPGAAYLSGKGGASYQVPAKFTQAGIELRYSRFEQTAYEQPGAATFVPGLSVVDALFSVGIDATRALVAPAA